MNSFIETLNHWGGNFLDFAGTMFWQSGLLIVALFALDFLLRRKIRASIRYAFWLVLLLKLILPPTLALPTSPVWWLYKTPATVQVKPQFQNFTVTYDSQSLPAIPENLPPFTPPKPELDISVWLLLISFSVSAILLLWLLARWWQIARQARRAKISERLTILANETQLFTLFAGIKFKSNPQIKLTSNAMSPAVCGLFRPVILIPQSLADNFSDEQLRAVLLHELIHLRRRDVWVNFLQSLLQIFYWWQPLVWLANARIRRVREEAVDDAVMLALRDDAENYAPTLLEVAKLAFRRPLASLGLVGILESRSALRQRIERLVNFRAPRKAGLTLVSLLGILAFTAVAVPMGAAPDSSSNSFSGSATLPEETLTLKVNPAVFIRNVKAQASWRLDSPTDNWTKILLDTLRSEMVDCPHGIKFNHQTGEITMQNTPEQLAIFRQVVEQLNRPDGLYQSPQIHRKVVLIQANLFWMNSDDREKLVADLQSQRGKNERAPHWIISPEQFNQINHRIASLHLHPFHRPRIQTSEGLTAEFYVGDKTNGVEFDCEPFVTDAAHSGLGRDGIALVFKTETVGNPSGAEQKLVGTNHYRTSGEIGVEDGGGFVVSAKNSDGSPTNLVMIVSAEVVTNSIARTVTHSNDFENESKVGQLVQDAKLDYEMGKLDEAETKLKAAIASDPGNAAAQYYLKLVEQARSAPKSSGVKFVHPALRGTIASRQGIINRLHNIRLKKFGYDAAPLEVVQEDLTQAIGEQDSSKLGVGFIQPPDLNSVLITIEPALTNVLAEDALAAIVAGANKPIKYSILEDGVEFSWKNQTTLTLYSRTFRLDTNTFFSNLKKETGLPANNDVDVSVAARDYFSKSGVDLKPPGKAIFYNEGLGLLFVRATEPDLEKVEKMLVNLNDDPPQIHIKARFLEVPKGTLDGLKKIVAVSNSTNQLTGTIGILTSENFKTVWQNLRMQAGVEDLAEPEVLTISGRQTQMRSTIMSTIITGFEMTNSQAIGTNTTAIFPQTQQVETGPILDVIPYVLADGYTINLTVIPSLVEFLGYDTPPTNTVKHAGENGVQLPVVFPDFRIREATANLNIWDGQTVVFGSFLQTNYVDGKEVVAKPNRTDKQLLVFVTANLVDAAGNRIHSDKEMSFAKTGNSPIPPQPTH